MTIKNKINNYLINKNYKIILKKKEIGIVNYDEIIDFSDSKISLVCEQNKIVIEGTKLLITKMLDDEILIKGNISIIRII